MLERAPGVEAFYGQLMVDVETERGQSFQVRAVEGELRSFPFRIAEGRLLQPDTYEAMAGQGLLNWLGLAVGDSLTLTLDDEVNRPVAWKIVGQYPEPVNAGQMLIVSLPTVTRVLRHAEPSTYHLKLSPDANPTQLKRYLEPRHDADLNLTLVGETIPSAVYYLQLAVFALAAILIGIALVNVFNASLLAVREKLHMVGVLKTLGMTPAQVVQMIATSAGVLGLVAACLGTPLGLMLSKAMLDMLSASYGFGRVTTALNAARVLLLPGLMVVASIAGSIIPARWAARTPIIQVLRYE
jgi:putative ABC transport system permease protein